MKTLLEIQKETAKEFQAHNARFAPFSLRIAAEIKKRIDELEKIGAVEANKLPQADRVHNLIKNDIKLLIKEWKSFLGELNVPDNVLKISIEIKQQEESE